MKKLILLLACVALPMAAFADTPAKTKKHKEHKTAASPAPAASPAAKASPAPKASPSPEAK
jgi:hypothetical protein